MAYNDLQHIVIYLLAHLTPEDNGGITCSQRLCGLTQTAEQGTQKVLQDVQYQAGWNRGQCPERLLRFAANSHCGLAKSRHAGRQPSSARGCGGIREGGEGPLGDPRDSLPGFVISKNL